MVVTYSLMFGPVKIGYSLATFLFGLVTAQTYVYYQDFTDDPLPLKLLVAVVWATHLTHQISMSHCEHWYLVKFFGFPTSLVRKAPSTTAIVVESSALISFLVPAFFTYRLWMSSKRPIQTTLLAFFLTARLITMTVLGVFTAHASSFVASFSNSRALIVFCWICGAAVDVSLTIALCYDLHIRQRSTMYRTARIIDRLKTWCIATGMATSTAATVMAICFCVLDNNLWVGILFILPGLFSNSLLASLNLRRSLRHMDQVRTSNLAQVPIPTIHSPSSQNATGISIHMDVLTDTPH
ncbi:hypothetical protein Hypma_004730 [Hypsizygus marmoreus]|uniref:DUF6534 domain-containing protein n=1 Tax=Hypsizygus marmoreus TaxID=39966 RepID=A0A369IZY3_HYPMA|nr:hypothetical protein Hypma_004730 [Hypsizygus marmoreus]